MWLKNHVLFFSDKAWVGNVSVHQLLYFKDGFAYQAIPSRFLICGCCTPPTPQPSASHKILQSRALRKSVNDLNELACCLAVSLVYLLFKAKSVERVTGKPITFLDGSCMVTDYVFEYGVMKMYFNFKSCCCNKQKGKLL